MMRCPSCHAGDRVAGATTLTLTRADSTIGQVPALVCDACGEASVDVGVAQAIEHMAARAIAAGVRYQLRDYVPCVA
jgi:YgiT-type zinc finger domain-containing protein